MLVMLEVDFSSDVSLVGSMVSLFSSVVDSLVVD